MRPMRHFLAASSFAFAAFIAPAALADFVGDVLWDNYPGDVTTPFNMTSERATFNQGESWTVDDVDLSGIGEPEEITAASPFYITCIEWVGIRDSGAAYDTADVMFTAPTVQGPGAEPSGTGDGDPDTTVMTDLTYASTILPGGFGSFEFYRGTVTFDEPIVAPTSRFYMGVRLVGNGTEGTNSFVAHSTDGTQYGEQGAFTWAPAIGGNDWRQTADLFWGTPDGESDAWEMAFRVYGYPVPEPAALILLVAGIPFALRRNR